ncbi:MAG: phenylalanine--tRNA ligase subunit beta, partial [Candidatus Dormiibacterota bacterium]
MRASFEWLCDLAGIDDLTPEQVATTLTMAGFNVDEVTAIDRSPIVVGRVLEQRPHPTSRNPLWVHQVDLGGEVRQIIAGAPNAGPGALVAVALPGTTVPSGRYVRDATIADVEGRGMLCSADELLLPSDEDGILLLAAGTPGQHLDELVPNDAVLEVEVEPNRPDCLGHLHLARELAAASGRTLVSDFMPRFTGGIEPPGKDLVTVSIEAPDLCRRYIGAVVSGVSVGRSPAWMRRRLLTAGVRPINNVVDVTNYVALELGQPLHAFDLTKLPAGPDGRRQIRVRRAEAGETLACLDGQLRTLEPSMLVIADRERPVAIAGVIGGTATAVTEATTEVLLEAANFDGPSVRSTSRALRLRTEASGRNEKGLSPELALAGARRAAGLYAEVAGGAVHVEWADEYPQPQEPVRVAFRPERIDRILGVHVPLETMEEILLRLGFQVVVHPDGDWHVFPPVFRLDVRLVEDVAEEVGRIYGYERVPSTLPGHRRTQWQVAEPGLERRLDAARDQLTGAGFTEIIGPSIVSAAFLSQIDEGRRVMRIVNPISEDLDVLRTTLLATLAQAALRNEARVREGDLGLFEIGRAYLRREEEPGPQRDQPDEPYRIGLLRAVADDADAGRLAFAAVKGAFERAASALAPHEFTYRRAAYPRFHPGRSASILVDGMEVGRIGELHPLVSRTLGLPARLVVLEVDAAPLLHSDRPRRYVPVPRFPAVDRALAVVVGEGAEAATLDRVIRAAGGALLAGVRAFDEYRGEQV